MKNLVKGKVKKKFKKWIIAIVVANLPMILAGALVASGLSAVSSFFNNLFSWGEKENIDINNCTIEQLIDAVGDKKVFTKEMLDEMMIDRKSFKRLLKGIKEFNDRDEKKTISVQFTYSYYTYEEVEIKEEEKDEEDADVDEDDSNNEKDSENEKDNKGKPKTITVAVLNTGTEYIDIEIDNNSFIDAYDMDWQTAYILAIYKSMANHDEWEYESNETNVDEEEEDSEPIKLKDKDVDEIINILKPVFYYEYDAVNINKNSYTKEEAQSVPNRYYSFTKVVNGHNYTYTGHIPISLLKEVHGLAFTDKYIKLDTHTVINTYSEEQRLLNVFEPYFEDFTLDLFYSLLENLPGGQKVANNYRQIFSQSKLEETE